MRGQPSRNALHKRAERARKRAQGLKRIELWIDPRIERTLRAFIRSAFGDKPMPARLHVGGMKIPPRKKIPGQLIAYFDFTKPTDEEDTH